MMKKKNISVTFKDLLNSFNVRSETLECLIMSGQNLMWRSIFGAEKKTKKKNPNPLSCLALSHSFPLLIVDWRAPLPPAGGQLWVPSASGTSVSVEPLIIYKWVFRERGQTICLLVMSHFTSMEVEGTGYEPGVAGHEWAGGGRQAAGCRPKYEDVFSRVFTDSRL